MLTVLGLGWHLLLMVVYAVGRRRSPRTLFLRGVVRCCLRSTEAAHEKTHKDTELCQLHIRLKSND
jgi:hypothetical protein